MLLASNLIYVLTNNVYILLRMENTAFQIGYTTFDSTAYLQMYRNWPCHIEGNDITDAM